MKKAELKQLIKQVITELRDSGDLKNNKISNTSILTPSKGQTLINPSSQQISSVAGVSPAEAARELNRVKRELSQAQSQMNEDLATGEVRPGPGERPFVCKNCGGSNFGGCVFGGCLEPWGKKGFKWTLNF